MSTYLVVGKLILAVGIQIAVTFVLQIQDQRKPYYEKNYVHRQIFFGIIYGVLSIVGTELGTALEDSGAVINVRDAAPLICGFMFGGPAGIIAGFIGGLERWFAVNWGAGTYSQLACTISTIFAGFYAIWIRKYIFDNKKPPIFHCLLASIIMEFIHMMILLITKSDDIITALDVIQHCIGYMVLFNGLSVFISMLPLDIFYDKNFFFNRKKTIAEEFQKGILICIFFVFVVSILFAWRLETNIAIEETEVKMQREMEDVALEIKDSENEKMLATIYVIEDSIDNVYGEVSLENVNHYFLHQYIKKFSLSEVNLIDKNGIVIASTNPNTTGFDMHSGEQAREFIDILDGKKDAIVQDIMEQSQTGKLMKYAGIKYKDGILQIGYNQLDLDREIQERVIAAIRHRRVGINGFYVLLNAKGEIIYDGKGNNGKLFSTFDKDFQLNEKTEKIFETKAYEKYCYAMLSKTDTFLVLALVPMEEVIRSRNFNIFIILFIQTIIYGILFALIYYLIKKVVLENIENTNRALSEITKGNLNEKVNIYSNKEFESLSFYINTTVDTLKQYIDDAEKRITSELEFAKAIQHSSLPSNHSITIDKNGKFDIYAFMQTAKEVGGDFYDFYFIDENKFVFLVADVSGKGIPAALFMMRSKTTIKAIAESGRNVGEILTLTNEKLCEGNDAEMFVTAWMGIIDLDTGLLSIGNAGHNPQLLYKNGEEFKYLKNKPGFVLAGLPGIKYSSEEIQLQPGDKIFLYTDGVTEATNISLELYGEERLQKTLNRSHNLNVHDICTNVNNDVSKFVDIAPQFDDITMLCFEYKKGINEISVKATMDNHGKVTQFVEEVLTSYGLEENVVLQFSIAVDEIFSNIVFYAYPEELDENFVKILVKKDKKPGMVSVTFIDKGIHYNPLNKNDPDIELDVEDREIGGLGVYMVKKSMDDVEYDYINEENHFTISKKY